MSTPTENRLDPLIHEPARLQLISLLNECSVADFNFLLRVTGLTRGNLSTHVARLVGAEYIEERKEFVNRTPHTEYRITLKGKEAFKAYVKAWEGLTRSRGSAAGPAKKASRS